MDMAQRIGLFSLLLLFALHTAAAARCIEHESVRGRLLSGLCLNPCAGQRDGAIFPEQTKDIITNCARYVICQNEADTFIACPKGQQFNPDTLRCQDAATAGCKVGKTSPKRILCLPTERNAVLGRHLFGIATNPCGGQRDGAVFPTQTQDVITNCDNYVVCKGGKDTFVNCPKGQQFNPDTLRCQDAASAGCKVGARSPKPIIC